jgi:hypothetical protein
MLIQWSINPKADAQAIGENLSFKALDFGYSDNILAQVRRVIQMANLMDWEKRARLYKTPALVRRR